MAAELGSLMLDLKANVARFEADMDKAAHVANQRSAAMARSFDQVKAALGGLGVGTSLVAFMKDVIETRAALDDLSDTTGDNVTTLDGLRRQAVISGVEFSNVGDSLTKLAKNLNSADDEGKAANAALRAIGLSVAEVRNQKPGEAFEAIAKALNRYEDGAAKVALAQALMGRAGATMLPVMKDIAETGALVGKITAEQAAQAEALGKKWGAVKLGLQDVATVIANPLVSALDETLTRLRDMQKLFESGSWLKGAATLGTLLSNLNPGAKLGTMIGQWVWGDRSADPEKRREDALASFRSGERSSYGAAKEKLKFDPEAANKAREFANRDAENMHKVEEAARKLNQELAKTQEQLALEAIHEAARQYQAWAKNQEELDRGLGVQIEQLERLKDIRDASRVQLKEFLDQMQFEASLVGKTAREVELMNAARSVDLELRRAIAAIPVSQDPFGTGTDMTTMIAVMQASEKTRDALLANIRARQAAEREWSTGVKQAMDEYADHATNAAEIARNAMTTTFKTLEDLQMDLVFNSGKNWRQIALQYVQALARMEFATANAKLLGSVGGGLGGILGKAFGFNTAGGEASSGGAGTIDENGFFVGSYAEGTNYVPRTGLALVHQGEQIVPAAANARGGTMVIHQNIGEGASVEAVREAFKQIRSLAAAVPGMAVSAVVGQARSNPGFTRALRGA